MAIEIRPLRPEETAAAKHVILSVGRGLYGPDMSLEAFIERYGRQFGDVDDYRVVYAEPDGIFLVVADGERVVGTGALRRWDADTAELKRMWLLEAYHRQGIGYAVLQRLLSHARARGYRRVVLTTGSIQRRAIEFYYQVGFRDIEKYHDFSEDVSMELRLDDAAPRPLVNKEGSS